MINPNDQNFTEREPQSGDFQKGETRLPYEAEGQGAQEAMTGQHATGRTAWNQTRHRVTTARERTEFFLRENPVPTIIGALAIGVAVGMAIRYASTHEERPIAKAPLSDVDLSWLTVPALWPFFRSVKRKAEEGADVIKDRVERVKDFDVVRVTKPIRKRWNAWAR